MRLGSFFIAGAGALAFTSTAFAAAPPACTGPAGDCDNDGILDEVDTCPWSATHTGDNTLGLEFTTPDGPVAVDNSCIAGTVTNHGAILGGPIWISMDGSAALTLGANADIGAFTKFIGTGDTTIAPKALIADAPNPDAGTSMGSGFLGRRTEGGFDPATTPDPAKEGGVTIGDALSAARAVTIGYGATLGSNVTLGYGAVIGPRATLRDGATVANLGNVGFGATLGANSRLGRGSSIGNFAVIGDGVRVGPAVTIGTYAEIGEDRNGNVIGSGSGIRIRRGATIGKWTQIEQGTSVGRNTSVGDYATIRSGVAVRSNSTVGDGADVDQTSSPDGDGLFPHGSNIAGNPANVPPEPSGTFFSAAGGVVCDDANGDGTCTRIPVYASGNVGSQGPANAQDEIVRYCLDEVSPFDSCDTTGVQAITITAPDTIGVSPYCDSSGCYTVQNANYQLQAGPIYVLSPPTP